MNGLTNIRRTFHVCLDLGYIMNATPDEAGAMLKDVETGRTLTSEEAKAKAVFAKAKGYAVLPMCDNHDAKGYCLGHKIEN